MDIFTGHMLSRDPQSGHFPLTYLFALAYSRLYLFGYLMPGYSGSHGRGIHGRPCRQREALHGADHRLLLLLLLVLLVLLVGHQVGHEGSAEVNSRAERPSCHASHVHR